MRKIELELEKFFRFRLVKIIAIEIVIMILAFKIFLDRKESPHFNIVMVLILLIIAILVIINNYQKHKLFLFCKENYINNPDEVILKIQKYNKNLLKIFDFSKEPRIFKEILDLLNLKRLYTNRKQVGPWDIIFDYSKTKEFCSCQEIYDYEIFRNLYRHIDEIPNEIKELLESFGVSYRMVFDIWDLKEDSDVIEYEIMYLIYGLITNDSQCLYKKFEYDKYYLSENVSILPHESFFEKDYVLIFHIKIFKFP